MKRLSKSGIEYLTHSWGFYSGCKNGCPYCWAKLITVRFPDHYPNGFDPTYYPEAFLSPLHLKKPSIIGCAFMGDLFGDWVDPTQKICSVMPSGKVSVSMSLKGWIFTTILQCPLHTFLFLTKQPQNLPAWSPFPPNVCVGVTTTKRKDFWKAIYYLTRVNAKVKYLSIEPFLEQFSEPTYPAYPESNTHALIIAGIKWVIIGALTGTKKDLIEFQINYPELTLMPYGKKWTLQPKIEWVEEIVRACDKAGIPVFLKDNLMPLLDSFCLYPNKNLFYSETFPVDKLRQEVLR